MEEKSAPMWCFYFTQKGMIYMKVRKRPVVVEAIQWTGKNHREMFDFLTGYQK